ncbi:hypothetical protein K32_40030 [Kaistia sp. 32K]|uniref:extensin-like domain-containing protein n=1 Tax=Kaistia sp. 32K TaxID=2795690 RepID=UPI0019164E93|nr:extensin family protein [Kaistia sp. 32K]BCP55386.1 hypothetical protein K32_40030 [Kaistia sp. 32K]
MARWRRLKCGMGGLVAALLVTQMPIAARAISPDELFQKVIPKVEPERKPAKRRPHHVAPAPEAKAPRAESSASLVTPLPTRRPVIASDTAPDAAATPPAVEPATPPALTKLPAPLPRPKPAEARRAAGLVAIPKPPDAAVEKVTTEAVPPDPGLAAGAAATLAGTVPADPATGGELAFAPPVLPSPLEPASSGRNADGSLKKSDRLPHPDPAATPVVPPEAALQNLPAPLPRKKPEVVLAAMIPTMRPVLPEALAACRTSMAAMKISAKPLPAIHVGSCGGPDPFDVTELDAGAVDLEPAARINCAVATTLARWVDEDIQPSATKLLGGRVTALRVADSYSCRGRNRVANAQLSEHAFLNAVDIGAFEVNGRWVTVTKAEDRTAKEDDFLKAARVSACDKFNTVLGPGSDGYHEDHYHLDLRQRGKGGGKKYCH